MVMCCAGVAAYELSQCLGRLAAEPLTLLPNIFCSCNRFEVEFMSPRPAGLGKSQAVHTIKVRKPNHMHFPSAGCLAWYSVWWMHLL